MQSFDSRVQVSFRNILLATDFTPSAQAAMLYALSIARRTRACVYLVHVVNPTTQRLFGREAVERAMNDAWREAQNQITDLIIAGALEGVKQEVIIREGDVWEELSKVVAERNIDLLVTGTRGRSGVLKLLLGSTAETIFRQAPCPVLTVGPKLAGHEPSPEGPKRILYSTGFARQSLAAGVYALSIARQQHAALAMLHVVREDEVNGKSRAQLEMEAKQKLLALIPADAELAAAPEIFVRFGGIADAILEVAEEWTPDLVVVGIRRQERDARRATWATAYNVVSSAPCPVLTVRTPDV